MKAAIICDTHLNNVNSAQYGFLKEFINILKKDGIKTVLTLGDITSLGERAMFEQYLDDLKDFDHHYVIGNSDVRDERTADYFINASNGFLIEADGMKILGIDTPYGIIEAADREKISTLNDGDILAMHYYVNALEEDSRRFITDFCERKSITVLHGHQHRKADGPLGRSRVIGFRAADPDKSVGDFPCITYITVENGSVAYDEVKIPPSAETLTDLRSHFGISCVDNHRDVAYALENGVFGVELRTNGSDWTPDYSLIPLIEEWRKKTNGYLSVHFPNLRCKNGVIAGKEQWMQAVEYAVAVKADGLTLHPPRIAIGEMQKGGDIWKEYLELYLHAVRSVPETVAVGIENMHMNPGEKDTPARGFGYTPTEVSSWIDEINNALGKPNRVGHVLDVGHARNNGNISEKYPISRWYEIMGQKAVAYHVHALIVKDGEVYNHNALESWFGPIVSYSSFFCNWEKGLLNHKPVFLEVQGAENYQISIDSFEKLIKEI